MIFLEIQISALRGESILLLDLIYSVIRSDYYISLFCSRANLSNSFSICMHPLSSSVQFSHSVMSNSLLSCGLQHARLPCLHHQLPELAQTHVHRVNDAIQPSHPLSSPSPPAFYLSQHQGLFKCISSSHQVARVLGFQFQHQSFQRIFRTDFL